MNTFILPKLRKNYSWQYLCRGDGLLWHKSLSVPHYIRKMSVVIISQLLIQIYIYIWQHIKLIYIPEKNHFHPLLIAWDYCSCWEFRSPLVLFLVLRISKFTPFLLSGLFFTSKSVKVLISFSNRMSLNSLVSCPLKSRVKKKVQAGCWFGDLKLHFSLKGN